MNKKTAIILLAFACFVFISSAVKGQTSNWVPVGPILFPATDMGLINGIGRVSQIKFDPVAPLRMYAVAPHAVFISNDTSAFWHALPGTNNLPTSLNCASLCIDKKDNNILYLGTGDANYYAITVGVNNIYNSNGVWKSVDGGASFVPSNTGMGDAVVIEIIMSPSDHNTLVAATSEGLYKTTDAGANWILTSVPDAIGDMCISAGPHAAVLYAVSNITETLYTSVDFGNTWTVTVLSNSLPCNGGRLAITPADTLVVYVSFVGSNTGDGRGGIIYISRDGGVNFTLQKGNITPNLGGYQSYTSGQGGYNYDIEADPLDPNTLYVCAHLIWKSVDAGISWRQVQDDLTQVLHTDQHHICFNPHNDKQLFNANDGGVFINRDHAVTNTWTPVSEGLAATEFYTMSNSHGRKYLIDGGTQDNGEIFLNPVTTNSWHTYRYGDWAPVQYFDLTNANKIYYARLGSRIDLILTPNRSESLNLPNPFSDNDLYAFSSQNGNLAFYCQSADGLPSPQYAIYRTSGLQGDNPIWTQITGNTSGFTPRSKMIAAAVAPADDNTLYVYSKDKTIMRTSNAKAADPIFTTLTPLPQPSGLPGYANFAILKNGIVYLSVDTYLYRSADQGVTWTLAASGPVTDAMGWYPPVLKMLTDTSHTELEPLYAFTTGAVYYKDNTMTDWSYFTTNLPTTPRLNDMDIFYDAANISNSVLRIATFGRGIWESKLATNVALPLKLLSISILSNPTNNVLLWKTAQESNSKSFDIEKSTGNPASFQIIGNVKASGGYGTMYYSFQDNNVRLNVDYYYRLKMIDIDGHYEYSSIVHARGANQSNTDINIAPNPVADGTVLLQITAPSRQTAELTIADVSGRVLVKRPLQVTGGLQVEAINVRKFSKGTYVMRVMLENGILLIRKFIKR